MAKYTFGQLEQLWVANGGSQATAPMAAAVALAESGGNSDSVSPQNSNGTHDQGLWQISRVGIDPTLKDPNVNARTAISMSQGGKNWHPWCTAYSDGACGTKGGTYLGSSSPFWQYLKGTLSLGGKGELALGGGAINATDPNPGDGAIIPDSPCLIKLPAGICLLSQSQGRALLGGLLLGAGGLVAIVGVAMLVTKTTNLKSGAMMLVNPASALASGAGQANADRKVKASPEQRQQKRRTVAGRPQPGGTKVVDIDGNEF